MSSDDLKNDSSRNTCSFNAHISYSFQGDVGWISRLGKVKSLFMVPLKDCNPFRMASVAQPRILE